MKKVLLLFITLISLSSYGFVGMPKKVTYLESPSLQGTVQIDDITFKSNLLKFSRCGVLKFDAKELLPLKKKATIDQQEYELDSIRIEVLIEDDCGMIKESSLAENMTIIELRYKHSQLSNNRLEVRHYTKDDAVMVIFNEDVMYSGKTLQKY